MNGFDTSPVISEFLQNIKGTGQKNDFEAAISCLRKVFEDCDLYFARMNRKSKRDFLSVGVKAVGADSAKHCVFRFFPPTNLLKSGEELRLVVVGDSKRRLSDLSEHIDLDGLERRSGKKVRYSINLKDRDLFEATIKKISNSHVVSKHMSGEGLNPDDYENIGLANKSQETGVDRDAPKGNENPQKKSYQRNGYQGDSRLREWILKNAKGKCESCLSESPFIDTSNKPFLEIHHVIHRANGGADTKENTVAICPNCHREFHYGHDRENKIKKLYRGIVRLKQAI